MIYVILKMKIDSVQLTSVCKEGSQYVKYYGLGYRKGCIVTINMFSSEVCKCHLEKIYDHFPVTSEESML